MPELSGKLSTGTLGGKLSGGGKMSGSIGIPKSTVIKNYEQLINKPKINGIELIGDKSFPELGLESLSNIEIENLLNA